MQRKTATPKQPKQDLTFPQAQAPLELQVKLASMHDSKFTRIVDGALNRTEEDQNRYINRHLETLDKSELGAMAKDAVDYRPGDLSTKVFQEDVTEFHKEFHDVALQATDIQSLYNLCSEYIQAEQHFLFYRTNDMFAARMKQDYFNAFLDQLLPVLEEDGLLDAQWNARFSGLKDAYRLGFDAYERLRIEMQEYTDDDTKSLLEEAEYRVHRTKAKQTAETFGSALEDEALAIVREILVDHYDLRIHEDDPAPPLLILLLRQLRTLSEITLTEQDKRTDFNDPKIDWFEPFNAIYEPLVAKTLELIAEDGSLENYARVSKDLQRQINEKDELPENFQELITQSVRAAGKTVLSRSQDYLLRDRDRLKLALPRSYTLIEKLLPGRDSAACVTNDTRAFLTEVESLAHAHSKNLLISYLDNLAAVGIDEAMFGWNHSANLLALRDFVAEFRRNLGQAILKSGLAPDARFLAQIQEVEEGLGYAYQSRNTAGEWLMEETHGGVEGLFEGAWLGRGWDPSKIMKSEIKELSEEARANLSYMARERGIPRYLSDHPMIPLIYERCHDIAQMEHEAEMAKQEKAIESSELKTWRERKGFQPRNYRSKMNADIANGQSVVALKGKVVHAMFDAPDAKYSRLEPEVMEGMIVDKMALDIMKAALDRITVPLEEFEKKASATINEAATADVAKLETSTSKPIPAQTGPEDDVTSKPCFNSHNIHILMEYLNARERQCTPVQTHAHRVH